jgi:hypothetical protein
LGGLVLDVVIAYLINPPYAGVVFGKAASGNVYRPPSIPLGSEADTYGIARLQKSPTAINLLARGTAQSTATRFSFPILLKKRRSASGLEKR